MFEEQHLIFLSFLAFSFYFDNLSSEKGIIMPFHCTSNIDIFNFFSLEVYSLEVYRVYLLQIFICMCN